MQARFSSGGWVCDGRDVPGGCRSGMTDFHQSSVVDSDHSSQNQRFITNSAFAAYTAGNSMQSKVFTITFRCPSTGFDLCEARVKMLKNTLPSSFFVLRPVPSMPIWAGHSENIIYID